MGQKDYTQRDFLEYNDVFADILNTLIFDGEKIVSEKELISLNRTSSYQGRDNAPRIQERDVVRFWDQKRIRVAFFGMEAQSRVDYHMPLRILGYDGATYRDELNKYQDNTDKNAIYPCITLVLYFGEQKWQGPRSLKECFDKTLYPSALETYISDYKINVVDVATLSLKTIDKFTSDFKTIAEYFYQTRHQETWFQPSSREVSHPHELSALLSELTQNTNWLYLEDTLKDEDNKMSNDLLAKMMARSNEKAREEGISIGLEKGRGEGREEGREENREEVLLNMLRDNMPIEKITQYLNLTKEKVEAIGRKYQLLK